MKLKEFRTYAGDITLSPCDYRSLLEDIEEELAKSYLNGKRAGRMPTPLADEQAALCWYRRIEELERKMQTRIEWADNSLDWETRAEKRLKDLEKKMSVCVMAGENPTARIGKLEIKADDRDKGMDFLNQRIDGLQRKLSGLDVKLPPLAAASHEAHCDLEQRVTSAEHEIVSLRQFQRAFRNVPF